VPRGISPTPSEPFQIASQLSAMINSPGNNSHSTGLRPNRPLSSTGAGACPLSRAWISEALIADHRRVWSRIYRRPVSIEEAVEIIMNIKRLAEAILHSIQSRGES